MRGKPDGFVEEKEEHGEEEEVAYHQQGDKTEAIYVSNLKGDNTKFYRFFRVAELGRGRGGREVAAGAVVARGCAAQNCRGRGRGCRTKWKPEMDA